MGSSSIMKKKPSSAWEKKSSRRSLGSMVYSHPGTMAETVVEVRPILDAAEQAASVQDFASAERFLRQAATLQEAQLGATHPDLANTLNNLGIVCERTGHTSA